MRFLGDTMHKLLKIIVKFPGRASPATVALVLLVAGVASATNYRYPLATIPAPSENAALAENPVAASNGILAISYARLAPEVYLYSIGSWSVPIASLTISDSNAIISSIAIQNNYIAVGAQDENTGAGAVYVFAKPEAGWQSESATAVLTPSDSNIGFGYSVSVWGNTLLTQRAAAYIFIEPETGWVNATETAQLTASDAPFQFPSQTLALAGSVGSGGSLAVVQALKEFNEGVTAYIFVESEGGWTSMTQTAELTVPNSYAGGSIAAVASAIAVGVQGLGSQNKRPYGAIWIFDEPKGGWVSSSTPTYTPTAPVSACYLSAVNGFAADSLTQNGHVLVGGIGSNNYKTHIHGSPTIIDEAYLWHADQEFSIPIVLSAKGLTTTLYSSTVTANYAFAWDEYGNVFVFNGK
jgi:hypothetical protein